MSGKLIKGKGTYGEPTLFGTANDVHVGNYCSIAQNVIMDCGLNHNYVNLSTFPFNSIYPDRFSDIKSHPITRGDIVIGNDVWIGRDVTIMSGVKIGDGAIIGTKSLITKDVEPYAIVGGVPAQLIRYRFDKETIEFFKKIKWWNWGETEVLDIVPILMDSDISKLKEYVEARSEKLYRDNKIAFYTRSMNDDLYSKMKNLFDNKFDFVRVTNINNIEGGRDYLYKLIFDDRYDWVINLDEDMFIYNESKILSLLDHMIDNEYDYCGIPDGGACVHRFHSPIVMNPFFNIFNTRKIRDALDSTSFVNGFKYSDDMAKFIPYSTMKPNHAWKNDNFEPYYPLFYWLPVRGFKPLYLNSYEYDDGAIFEKGNPNNGLNGISTIIKNHKDEEIGIHTWYSRLYGKDQFHTIRIDNAYELAKSKHIKTIEVNVELIKPVENIKIEATITRENIENNTNINTDVESESHNLDLAKLNINPVKKNTRKSK